MAVVQRSPFAGIAPEDEGNSCDSFHLQVFLFLGNESASKPSAADTIRLVRHEPFWGYGEPFSGQFVLLGEVPRAASGKRGQAEVGLRMGEV